MDQHIKKKEVELEDFVKEMKGMIKKEKEAMERVITVTNKVLREPVETLLKRDNAMIDHLVDEVIDGVDINSVNDVK